MTPDDVVVGVLVGALKPKCVPAVVIASSTYLMKRPDVLVGILTDPRLWIAGPWRVTRSRFAQDRMEGGQIADSRPAPLFSIQQT